MTIVNRESDKQHPFLVGCVPNSADFSHPADRRRYVYYFYQKGIAFENARYDKDYDIIYISLSADLFQWSNYKTKQLKKNKKIRVVFDLSDSYLTEGLIKDHLRSLYHYCCGRTSALSFSFKRTILTMIDSTDVLICGSAEQKNYLDKFHKNVVVVRDYLGHDVNRCKSNYELSSNNELNILWEGFSHGNIKIFQMIGDIIESIDGFNINMHFVTDPEYCKIGTNYLCQPTYKILKEIFSKSDIRFHLYDWNTATFSSIATCCDLALIPIPNDPVMINKPENKLLLLWSLGLPVITSKTPSYARVMNDINEDFICSTNEDWRKKIIDLASSQERREKYMKSANLYIRKYCSSENIMKTWDKIFFDQETK